MSYLLSGAGAGTAEAGFSIDNTDHIFFDGNGEGINTQPTLTGTTETYIAVVGHPSGGICTYSRYVQSTGVWTHGNGNNAIANQIAAAILRIGSFQNDDYADAWIGLVGWWEGEMSSANRETLDNNWRTSDWWTNAHGQPTFLAQLTTTSPTDLAGNASSLTVTGATVDAGETLASWNFDGTGSAANVKAGAGIIGP